MGESSWSTGVGGDQTNNGANQSGAAYVFERSAGTWGQQAYLKASNTGGVDQFGSAIAVTGDRIAVGALFEASPATGIDGSEGNGMFGAGAVYVFERGLGSWGQTAYIKSSNTAAWDQFGWSLALSGDTLVVAARLEDSAATGIDGDQLDNSAPEAGAAYIFAYGGGTWSQQAYLKASNSGSGDNFGASVGISGERVIVGAAWEDSWAVGVGGDQADNSMKDSGAAYLFERQEFSTTWTQKAYMKASYGLILKRFGYRVGISGETIVASAPYDSSGATGVDGDETSTSAYSSGAAHVFDLASTCGVLQFGSASAVNIASLSASQLPFPDTGFTIDLTGFQGNGAGLMLLSTGITSLPSYGGTLYVDPFLGVPSPVRQAKLAPSNQMKGADHVNRRHGM